MSSLLTAAPGYVIAAGYGGSVALYLAFVAVHSVVPDPWYAALPLRAKMSVNEAFLSTLHALWCCAIGFATLFAGDAYTEPSVCVGPSPDWRRMCLLLTVGYFLHDLQIEVTAGSGKGGKPDPSMIFHHVFITVTWALALHFDMFTWFMCTLLLNEASTPFLNLRWYLAQRKRNSGQLYVINGISLVVMFFVCRVVLIPLLAYVAYLHNFCYVPDMAGVRLAMVGMFVFNWIAHYSLNVFWFYKLARGALKTLASLKDSTDKKTS